MNAQPEKAAQAVNYNMEEFFRLSARCEDNPQQVQAVAAMYQARLINFRMVKELLQLSEAPASSADEA